MSFNRQAAGEIFWEAYKSVTGMRPRSHRFYEADCSDAEAESILEYYLAESERVIQREYDEQERKIAEFERTISTIQSVVDCSREQAIYHYVESLRPDAYDLRDVGYLCYVNDLPYHLEPILKPAAEELLKVMEMVENA